MSADLDAAWDLLSRGDLAQAEKRCRDVLGASKNRSVPAWTMLGSVLREQGSPRQAEAAFRRALSLAPRDVYALHNLGALLSAQDRPEDALPVLNRAQSLGLNAQALHVNRGRALMQLYKFDEAENAYARAVAIQPVEANTQSMLAQLRYMRGDVDFARDLASACRDNPAHAGLLLTLAETQRRSSALPAAESTLRKLRERVGEFPEACSAMARVLLDAGRVQEAASEALRGLSMRPADSNAADIAVNTLLAAGRPDQALMLIESQRRQAPDDQRWVAYESSATRLLNLPRYRQLYDYARFVRAYDIAVPKGWSDIGAFNSALETALRARHMFKTHPLDQSLRQGSQTARNLVTDSNACIQALIGAFAAPLADYVREIEVAAGHPLDSRGRQPVRLKGCWSVALRGNGYHVNHVHSEGWISSAYYVKTPASVADSMRKSGWIKFGESPLLLPALAAEHFVQPRPGRLVLFPSYMWHGTNPVLEDEERLSVAFDAVAPRLSAQI